MSHQRVPRWGVLDVAQRLSQAETNVDSDKQTAHAAERHQP
jgi:hypothetical protein